MDFVSSNATGPHLSRYSVPVVVAQYAFIGGLPVTFTVTGIFLSP